MKPRKIKMRPSVGAPCPRMAAEFIVSYLAAKTSAQLPKIEEAK